MPTVSTFISQGMPTVSTFFSPSVSTLTIENSPLSFYTRMSKVSCVEAKHYKEEWPTIICCKATCNFLQLLPSRKSLCLHHCAIASFKKKSLPLSILLPSNPKKDIEYYFQSQPLNKKWLWDGIHYYCLLGTLNKNETCN